MNRSQTLDEVIQSIGEGAMALGQADRAALYLRHEDDHVSAPWARGLSAEYLEQVTNRVEELPGNLLLQGPEPVLISDLNLIPEKLYCASSASRKASRELNCGYLCIKKMSWQPLAAIMIMFTRFQTLNRKLCWLLRVRQR